MRHAVKPLVRRPQDSLAAWVGTLDAGSPCFCCGSPLQDSLSDGLCDCPDASSLSCPVCGARVVDDTCAVLPAVHIRRAQGLAAA